MKNKKLRIISLAVGIFLVAAILVVVISSLSKNTKDEVTVKFETEGSSVEPITLEKGGVIENVPKSFMDGYKLLGWFMDKTNDEEFDFKTAINEDLTLYAKFKIANIAYEEEVKLNKKVTIISEKIISIEDFKNSISIEDINGKKINSYEVENIDNEYTIIFNENTLKSLTTYTIKLSEGLFFKDLDIDITEYTFKTTREDGDKSKIKISFETGEGSKVSPIYVNKGDKIEKLPQSFNVGYSFIGWYTDEEQTAEFDYDKEIKADQTLYAGFVETIIDVEEDLQTQYYEEDVATDKKVVVIANKPMSKSEFLSKVGIVGVTGEVPASLDVTVNNNEFTIDPGKDGYEPAKQYKITIPGEFKFKDLESRTKDYTFRIAKERVEKVTLNEEIKYILAKDVMKLDTNSQNTSDESSEEESRDYVFLISKSIINAKQIKVDDILCIGETEKYDPEVSLFVKVLSLELKTDSFLVYTTEAQIEEIFDEIDVNFKNTLSPAELIGNVKKKELEDSIRESESFKKFNQLLAGSIYTNKVVKRKLGAPDFTKNAYVKEDTLTEIGGEFAKGVKIEIGIGVGYNPNFDKEYENDFLVLTVKLTYETRLKRKVDISCEFTITQYLALSMQGSMDYCVKLFKKKWLRFDYALNIYSQTDIDLTVLVKSVNAKDDKYTDISEQIKNKLAGKDEDEYDSDNVAKQLREMLDANNGDIELFRAPLIYASYPVVPILPVLDINLTVDFVVKVNFALAINTDISVLEANQVGVQGDTRTGDISAINNTLPGGDQYSVELSVCGYLGFKAGFEGGLTISFFKTSYFGEIGLFVFVGPYFDLYGFAQVSLVRQGKYVELGKWTRAEIAGGYYMEVGINVEIELAMRSKFFKVKIGTKLVDEKIKLFSLGDKNVLLKVNPRKEETIILSNSNKDRYTTTDYKRIINNTGVYLNITNGNEKEEKLDYSKFYLKFTNPCFSYDKEKGTITYDRSKNGGKITDECIMTYYYAGACIQLQLNSANFGERFPAGKIKILWGDTSEISQDKIGKTYKATVKVVVNDKVYSERSYDVKAGLKLGYIDPELPRYDCGEGSWDKDPRTTIIKEDTTFTYTTKKNQVYVSFAYHDKDLNKWVIEVKAVNVGEIPVAPEVENEEKLTFLNWKGQNGINNLRGYTSSNSLSETINGDQITDTIASYDLVKDKSTTEVLWKVSGTTYLDALNNLKDCQDENKVNIYYMLMHMYTANYEKENCKVTIVGKNRNGEEVRNEMEVEYGSYISNANFYDNIPMQAKIKGYSLNPDGSDVQKMPFLLYIDNDYTFYTVYEYSVRNVDIKYYDDVKKEYVQYKHIDYTFDKKFDEKDLTDADSALIKIEGVTYELLGFKYTKASENHAVERVYSEGMLIDDDIIIKPTYKRTFKITFDGNGGTVYGDSKQTISSDNNYSIYLGAFAEKTSNYYKYEFVGWMNKKTGEVYAQGTSPNITDPTTLIAKYNESEIVYNVIVDTKHGVLLNGKTKDSYSGDYDGYKEFIDKYLAFTPEDVKEEHWTYIYRGREEIKDSTGTYIASISYQYWDTQYNKYKLTIDVNGGDEYSENVIEYTYGNEVDLSIFNVTKADDLRCSYKLLKWVSNFNKEYNPNDKLVIEGNTTIKAIWTEDVYKEYIITYYVNDEKIEEVKYHLGDEVNELARPNNTMNYKFSGWKWYDGEKEITKPSTMPSKNLTVKATTETVYVIYYLDGKEYQKVEAKANQNNDLIAKPIVKGHTVSEWTSDDVTIQNGKFLMPENNISIKSTSTVNSYNVSFIRDGKEYKPTISVKYGSNVTLPELPVEENMFFGWTSDDVTIVGGGFVMPDMDVTLEVIYTSVRKHLIYVVNNEIVKYELLVPGEQVKLEDLQGNFSGWYSPNININKNTFNMPNSEVFVYGYTSSGNIKVNVYIEGTDKVSYVLYGSCFETLITPEFENLDITNWTINGQSSETLTIPNTTLLEINAYANIRKTYTVSFNFEYPFEGELTDINYVAEEKVYLPSLPQISDVYNAYGWKSFDGITILTDENGKDYFIMPKRNVVLNAWFTDKNEYEGYMANVYVKTPYDSEPVKLGDYLIWNNDGPVYFFEPKISGYEFVYFMDSDQNIYNMYNGVTLDTMGGKDKVFTAYYREVSLQVATFMVGGDIIDYQSFYSKQAVSLKLPTYELPEGFVLTEWYGPNIKIYSSETYLDESNLGKDLTLHAIAYRETGEYSVELVINTDSEHSNTVSLFGNENDELKICTEYDGISYNVEMKLICFIDSEQVFITIPSSYITNQNGYAVITLPEINKLQYNGKTINASDINYFEISLTA